MAYPRRMVTSVCKGMLLLLCGLVVSAPAASAQEDKVFVDPDSPSGKEYELPIDRARQQGAPQTQAAESARGSQAAPLFGAGVKADSAATTARGSGEEPRGAGSADSTDPANGSRSDRAEAPAVAARKAQAAVPEGGVGVAAIIGIAAGVLLLGGLLGLLLRRRAAP